MILGTEVSANDVEEMTTFYKAHFSSVEVVRCNECMNFLCFELAGGADPMGMPIDADGKIRVNIGNYLMSYRIRLDETEDGQPMVGYQCGAPVPNPKWPMFKKHYEEELAKAEKNHKKTLAEYEKDYKKRVAEAKKKGVPAPSYLPPEMPQVFLENNEPEFIECGNDTRIAEIERELVPTGNTLVQLTPFEKHKIKEQIRERLADKRYKRPDFKQTRDTKKIETFSVAKV